MNLSNGTGLNDQQAQHARNLLAHMAANQSKQGQPGQQGQANGSAGGGQTPGQPGPMSLGLDNRRISGPQDLAVMANAMGMIGSMPGGASKDAMIKQVSSFVTCCQGSERKG